MPAEVWRAMSSDRLANSDETIALILVHSVRPPSNLIDFVRCDKDEMLPEPISRHHLRLKSSAVISSVNGACKPGIRDNKNKMINFWSRRRLLGRYIDWQMSASIKSLTVLKENAIANWNMHIQPRSLSSMHMNCVWIALAFIVNITFITCLSGGVHWRWQCRLPTRPCVYIEKARTNKIVSFVFHLTLNEWMCVANAMQMMWAHHRNFMLKLKLISRRVASKIMIRLNSCSTLYVQWRTYHVKSLNALYASLLLVVFVVDIDVNESLSWCMAAAVDVGVSNAFVLVRTLPMVCWIDNDNGWFGCDWGESMNMWLMLRERANWLFLVNVSILW